MDNEDKKKLNIEDMKVDQSNLYREEIYTDLKVATIKKLVPVNVDGSPDKSRTDVYVGETHVMSQRGTIPIQCPLNANTFNEALQNFPEAVSKAVDKIVEEVKELQRREAAKIVTPADAGKKIIT